ncbi:MAG: replicative DNA helicase [Cellvibrionaceae bacterium]
MNNLPSDVFSSMTAEQAVIGSLLSNPTKFDDVVDILDEYCFLNLKHRDIFRSICSLVDSNEPIDVITVCEDMEKKSIRADMDYISELFSQSFSSANVKFYSKIVFDCWLKREVYDAASETIRHMAENSDMSSQDAVEYAQAKMIALGDIGATSEGVEMNVALKSYVEHLDKLQQQGDVIDGLETGLIDMDSRLNGLKGGNLAILAGRPGQGKTTLALVMASNMSIKNKKRGIYFSFEMNDRELTQKLVAHIGQIPLNHLKKPSTTTGEFWSKLSAGVSICKDSPLSFVDAPGMHINQVKAYARKAHKRAKLDYIMIDHMHLMDGDGDRKDEKVGSISRGLKQLAKELDIPVIALAQLNRGVEERANKRPMLSDLRESGRIEEDADIVQFIYRDEYYNENTDNPGVMEVSTAKFRDGEVGTDYFTAKLHTSSVFDMAQGSYVQPPPIKSVKSLRTAL